MMDPTERRIGVYIHLPFCAGKCAYCDFNSRAGCDQLIPQYQRALLTHIAETGKTLAGYYVDTVYFGGGTPTHYGADRLVELFDALITHASVLRDAEVTFEANPESVTAEGLEKLRRAGFNRMSLGVQSANNAMLQTLGRLHTFERAQNAVAIAREAGFENISCDLMFGLPSQSKADWAATLKKVIALKPDHLSCYGLKLEEGTPLYSFRDTPFMPDDDTQADMYLYAVEQLRQFGYRQYEISNFAQRGRESRHNLKYWRCEEYIGFGAGAHSYFGSLRYSCTPDIREYIDGVLTNGAFIDSSERITPLEQAGEYLMLGLRTGEGISLDEYRQRYRCSTELVERYLHRCAEHSWAREHDGRWSFTPEGFLISNTLIGDILELQQRQLAEMNRYRIPDLEVNDGQTSIFRSARQSNDLFRGL